MKSLSALIITSLIISACSGSSSSLSRADCPDTGSPGGDCSNNQPDSNIVFLKSRRYGGQYCGDRIKVDEVLLIDLQSPEGKTMLEQAGPYKLLTESPIGIKSRGSQVQTLRAATKSAASRGCNLLLTGPVKGVSWKTDNTGLYDPASTSRLERYLLVRMAKLQDQAL